MRRILTASLALGAMLTVASCSSDEAADTTTAGASTVPSSTQTVSTETVSTDTVSTTEGAATTPTTAGDPAPPPDVSVSLDGLTDLQAQVFTQTVSEAAQIGFAFDQECFKAGVAKLSATDAQAILDAGPAGDPQLSAEGQAIGAELQQCAVTATTGTG
jgi:hypothetical protein